MRKAPRTKPPNKPPRTKPPGQYPAGQHPPVDNPPPPPRGQKNAITFDLTEIERNKDISAACNFVAHPLLPSKMSKSQEKKSQIFSTKSRGCHFIDQKYKFLEKKIFSDCGGSSRHFDYLFTCLGLMIKLLINYFKHHVDFMKNNENHVNFKF